MAVTIEVWDPDGNTKRRDLTAVAAPPTPDVADPHWSTDLERATALILYVASNSADLTAEPTLLDGRPILKVVSDGTDGPGFKLLRPRRIAGDTYDVIQLRAKSLKDGVLQRAALFGYGGMSGLRPDTRMFGFMDPNFVPDAAWVTPESHGKQGDDPFGDGRPDGWSDRDAEYITDDTAAENNEGRFRFLADLTVAEEMDVRFECTADESFRLYLDGTEILASSDEGEYQWGNTYDKVFTLTAGTYQMAADCYHQDRPVAGVNIRWFLFSAMAAGAGGAPAAQREVQHVHNDATTGNMSLTFAGDTTADFAHDASASTVETELNALESVTDVGGVSVTGSGTSADPWVVTFNDFGNQPALSGTGDGTFDGTITISEETDGSKPDVLLRSNTADWTVLPIGEPDPGMTAGRILQLCVSEEQSRGRLTDVTEGFTAAADSDGNSWSETFELGLPVGSTLDRICDRFAALGVDTGMDADLTLQAWEGRGTDLSASVTLALSDCESVEVDRDADVVNGLLVRTSDDWTFEEDATAVAADGSLIDFVALGSQPNASGLPADMLADNVDEVDIIDAVWPDTQGPDPYSGFDVGDTITVPGWDGSGVAARCVALRGRIDRAGNVFWHGEFTV